MNPDHALLRAWTEPVSAAHCSPVSTLFDVVVHDVDRVAGRVAVRFAVPSTLRDADDAAPTHRALCAMLDCALGFAGLAVLEPPETIVTATLRLESVGRASGAHFEARGELVGRNATTFFARATLHDASGRVVVLASSTLRLVAGPR